MLQTNVSTKRSTQGLKASNERLQAITKNINRIQKQSARAWTSAEMNMIRTKELREDLDKLLIEQEESLIRLTTLAGRS
ncbi:hypothetical protein [Paenibacillus sp. An7]|uniref:hypothetical protein n=1 Tax=Paenibacillus sp. An7 TaxID=2689577 RepID=UPI00135C1A97|nr:hypothetical protein [Paenibacillus sp. An7]